jgi:hypothetical protein
MHTACLVEAIAAARENWNAALALVPPTGFGSAAPCSSWTVKDVLAHVAWHELEMTAVIETHDLAGSPWWELPTDDRNDRIYELYKTVSLKDVLSVSSDAYSGMLAALQTLSDEDMNDPGRFKNMPADWTPWRVIASNTYEHYLRHVAQIRAIARWLEEN